MPINETYWNPYRLIPVRDRIEKKPPQAHDRFNGKSGVITCTLENLTPFFVGKNKNNSQLFLECNNKPVIPGSSIKGMLRSLSEIIGGGCNISDGKKQHNTEFSPCKNAKELCIACRMFGMMEGQSHGRVHMGNVSSGDALIREEIHRTKTFQILLSNCGKRHEPFYRTPGTGQCDGKARKFYFHQPQRTDSVPVVPENLRSRAWDINALLPGHHFDFHVHFTNLRKEELELLIYSLALEDECTAEIGEEKIKVKGPLRHKLGNGKPLGLGSCRISITKLVYLSEPKQRFSSLIRTNDNIFEDANLIDEISALKKRYSDDSSATMQQLRKVMIWDINDQRSFSYPDYYWFKNPTNSGKPLKVI